MKSIVFAFLVLSANALSIASRGSHDLLDDESDRNFEMDTVDEVHDFTPETQLLQLQTIHLTDEDMQDPHLYGSESADLRNDFNRNDELEEFDPDFGFVQLGNHKEDRLRSRKSY